MGQIREFFQIRFSTFWLGEPKCTESDLKKIPEFVPFGPKSAILVFDQVDANGEVDEVNRRHVLPVGARRTMRGFSIYRSSLY